MEKLTFVLAGDYGYIRYIEATLKSICYHHDNCKVYILNQDIPQEWFISVREKMSQKQSELVDVKLTSGLVSETWKLPPFGAHMNHMSFARYFIPQFVEEDKVLYLDSDTIVTRSLDELFEIELGDKLLAAAKVIYGLEDRFNSGVLLVNNKLWKEENIQAILIEITDRDHETLPESDQTVFNRVAGERYIVLDDTYNFQVGYDRIAEERQQYFILEMSTDPLPAIIHYLSGDKPWNLRSYSRLREVWWRYSMMDWSEIANHKTPRKKRDIFIMTDSQSLEQIDYLVTHLPNFMFHIAANTLMGDILNCLRKYENVRLYPAILDWNRKRLVDECDIYLDINYEEKNQQVIETAKQKGKPILTFDTVVNPYHVDQVFSSSEPQKMCDYILSL